jgi:hypothetical protein
VLGASITRNGCIHNDHPCPLVCGKFGSVPKLDEITRAALIPLLGCFHILDSDLMECMILPHPEWSWESGPGSVRQGY